LKKFDISNNDLSAAGAKVLGEALRSNQVMTEINISSNYLGKYSMHGDTDISGVVVLADVFPGMGALMTLDISSNALVSASSWMEPPRPDLKMGDLVDGKTVTIDPRNGLIKLRDFSGIITLADAIPDMRALTKLDISNNNIEEGGELWEDIDVGGPRRFIIELCHTKGVGLSSYDSESDVDE
jgi:hypothetical protein